MSDCIKIIREIEKGKAEFLIEGELGADKKLVIPEKKGKYILTNLALISKDIKEQVEEIEIAETVTDINRGVLGELPKLRKITFKRDCRSVLKGLPNLEEVVIEGLYQKDRLLTKFVDLPKIKKISLLERPTEYRFETVVNCESLYVQSLMHENLMSITEEAFVNTADKEIILPKSLNNMHINSFKSGKRRIVLRVLNQNMYMSTRRRSVKAFSYTSLGVEIHGLKVIVEGLDKFNTIKAKESELEKYRDLNEYTNIVVMDNLESKLARKIEKAKLLGVKLSVFDFNYDIDSIRMSLILTEEEHIRYSIQKCIRDTVYNEYTGDGVISNGYTAMYYEINDLDRYIYKNSNSKISLYEFKNYTVVMLGDTTLVYCVAKDYLIDNLDRLYRTDYNKVSLGNIKNIGAFRNRLNTINDIKEIDKKLIIQYRNGKKEEVSYV